ncbi:lytic transglycosylase domain-containing protein [Arthrobacter sp. CAN_C5]|uniref:aggregation-promoting factor C-terminal-like domain-containing protein n=1 Tax=Arthrobacter sp. CAN_C5 TaxID=2760706 RepID=UPI0028AD5554|nr:lytic transglycosylase domain-containing protein [Arthrobacter sp. CAN_C5]MBP2217523.1 outer membrane biosynthesis protein TonB [Arthrobacter sp. CAN_C5]
MTAARTGAGAALAVLALGASLLTAIAPAAAQDFPTWEEIRAAKDNTSAKQAQVVEIESLLDGLQSNSAELGDAAVHSAAEHAQAAQELRASERLSDTLAVQLAGAEAESEDLHRAAGAAAALSYKTGSANTGMLVLLDPEGAMDLLDRMMVLERVTDRAAGSYSDAVAAEREVESLRDQYDAATDRHRELATEAAQRLTDAQEDDTAARAAVQEHQSRSAELFEQLAELKDTTASLEAERITGLAEQAAFLEQQAAAEAAAKAREAAAALSATIAPPRAPAPPAVAAPAPQPTPAPRPTPPAPVPTTPAPAPAPRPAPAPAPAPAPRPAPGPAPEPVPAPAPAPAPAPGPLVDDPAGAQAYASSRLPSFGWDNGQFQCLVSLWNKESRWLTSANNPYSGAYGIPQSLPGSKMASSGADWRTNYRTQIEWGLGYIDGRYGSPCAAWQHSQRVNWY